MAIWVRVPWLSEWIDSSGKFVPWMSLCNWSKHFASLGSSEQVLNQAVKVDIVRKLIFQVRHKSAPFLMKYTWSSWDLQLGWWSAQTKPKYTMREWLTVMLMVIVTALKCSRNLAADLKFWVSLVAPIIWVVMGADYNKTQQQPYSNSLARLQVMDISVIPWWLNSLWYHQVSFPFYCWRSSILHWDPRESRNNERAQCRRVWEL